MVPPQSPRGKQQHKFFTPPTVLETKKYSKCTCCIQHLIIIFSSSSREMSVLSTECTLWTPFIYSAFIRSLWWSIPSLDDICSPHVFLPALLILFSRTCLYTKLFKYFSSLIVYKNKVSYANQSCIYLIKNTVQTAILWNIIKNIFYLNIFENAVYSCEFSAALLKFSVSHDQKLICWFDDQEFSFFIIINSWTT